ncbi:MAG: hypothetical protein ACE5GV_02535 [Candidatus Scalindua sp.]
MDILVGESAAVVNRQKKRKYLGIHFACCNIYGRIYNYSGKQYEGKCPGCLGRVTVRVGRGGVSNRFFVAS